MIVPFFDKLGQNLRNLTLNKAKMTYRLFGLRNELGHSQCKTLSQSPRQLITYYLWYFADVATYLLKKEVEKIRLQVLFRL